MSSFLYYVSRHLDAVAQEKQKREDRLAALDDESLNHEYQTMCEDVRDDGYNLGVNANKFFWNKDIPLEEIESDWQQFTEHVETLQALHAEFLRRYFERKAPQRHEGGTENATV